MLFSILIPVYNAATYLQECVDSILQQSMQDFEIILCDDGSEDHSFDICEKIHRDNPQKVQIIHNETNNGILMTRRKLFEAAKGEWIFCVDSDDTIASDALEKVASIIEYKNPDMILFDLKCIHINGTIEIFKPNLIPNYIYSLGEKKIVCAEIYKNKYLNSLCTKIFRRELIDFSEDYISYSGLKMGEDLFQSYPLFDNAEKIIYINEILYLYKKNAMGITGKINKNFYEMRKILWEREDFYLKKWGMGDVKDIVVLRRMKDIVWFLVEVYQTYGRSTYQTFAEQVRKDGLLKVYKDGIHIQGEGIRTKVISFLVITGHDWVLGNYLWLEKRILSLR